MLYEEVAGAACLGAQRVFAVRDVCYLKYLLEADIFSRATTWRSSWLLYTGL